MTSPGNPPHCTYLNAVLAVLFTAGTARAQYKITGTLTNSVDATPVSQGSLKAEASAPNPCTSKTYTTISDAEGHFTLNLPCPSVWSMTAEAPHFPQQAFQQHGAFSTGIVLTPSQSTFAIDFPLVPQGSISGFLLDEAGEGIAGAQVTLLDSDSADPLPKATSTTDDRGFYEFVNLAPGNYLVAAKAQPWYALAAHTTHGFRNEGAPSPQASDPNLDVTYPITFYPGVTSLTSATILQLSAGANQQADFHLTAIPSVHLILPAPTESTDRITRDVKRRLSARPASAPPIEQNSVMGNTPFQPTSVTTNPDGSIDVGGFSPGTYTLKHLEPGLRSGPGAREEREQIFTIQKDATRAVSLNNALSASSASPLPEGAIHLAGLVEFNHQADAGAMILLVDITATPGSTHIRRQQSNTDGSFFFDQLPPGKYILVAVDHGWSAHLADAATLNSFLMHGVPIHLTGNTVLPHPVEATTSNGPKGTP